jgi:hypothetical protein
VAAQPELEAPPLRARREIVERVHGRGRFDELRHRWSCLDLLARDD